MNTDPCEQALHDMLTAAHDGRIHRTRANNMWIVHIGANRASLDQILALSIIAKRGWITWTPHCGSDYATPTQRGADVLAIRRLRELDDEITWNALVQLAYEVTELDLAEETDADTRGAK